MALLREVRVRPTDQTVSVQFRKPDGTVLVTLDVTRQMDPERPVPMDLWVERVEDIVIDPPNAPVQMVWDTDPLGGLRLVELVRRVPPHDPGDFVRYPALIAKQLVRAGYVRAVGREEEDEMNNPRLYIPKGAPHFGARKD